MQDLNHNFQTIQEEWIAYALSHSDSVPEILVKLEKENPSKGTAATYVEWPSPRKTLESFFDIITT